MTYQLKFAHGLKANVNDAINTGKIDEDDMIIFSDTDDELAFVGHNKSVKPIKSRTNESYTLNGTSIGALNDGDIIPAGTSIDDFIKLISQKPIHPTYIMPTISLTSDLSSLSYEVGTSLSPTFTASFTKNDAGDILSINIKKGTTEIQNGTSSPVQKKYDFVVAEGSNSFSSSASYAAGAIKKNNLNVDDSVGLIAAGTVNSSNLIISGKYKYFYGTSTNSEVSLNALNNYLGVSNGTTITINVPIGAKTIAFAYPSNLRDVSKVEYVEMNDGGMASNFNKQLINYELPNGAIKQYKLYTYEMAVQAAAQMTIKATV